MQTTPVMEQMKTLIKELKLGGMYDVIEHRLSEARHGQLSGHDLLLSLLLDEKNRRDQTRYDRAIKKATLGQEASLEVVDWDSPLALHRGVIEEMASCSFVPSKENILITGPCGVGKSFVAALLGHHAVRQKYDVTYKVSNTLFDDLYASRADGSHRGKIKALAAVDILIIDDWALTGSAVTTAQDFYEIVSSRYEKGSTIITSQRAVNEWHDYLAEPLLADACMDRLVHNALRVEIVAEKSYREIKAEKKKQSQKRSLKTAEKESKK